MKKDKLVRMFVAYSDVAWCTIIDNNIDKKILTGKLDSDELKKDYEKEIGYTEEYFTYDPMASLLTATIEGLKTLPDDSQVKIFSNHENLIYYVAHGKQYGTKVTRLLDDLKEQEARLDADYELASRRDHPNFANVRDAKIYAKKAKDEIETGYDKRNKEFIEYANNLIKSMKNKSDKN